MVQNELAVIQTEGFITMSEVMDTVQRRDEMIKKDNMGENDIDISRD